MSKSILTGKTFKNLNNENEKLQSLDGQMEDLASDFNEMQRSREEAKKQMEAKFQDVYHKISLTQDYITSEGKRINDTLLAFSSKFDFKLDTLSNTLQTGLNDLTLLTNNNFQEDRQRLKDNEQALAQEKADRIQSLQSSNQILLDHLAKVQEQLDFEKSTREKNEKDLLRQLQDVEYKLSEKIELESQDRKSSSLKFKQEIGFQLESQKKLSENFHQKSVDEFNLVVDNILKEIDNRFTHQDVIVDNLSTIVKTIQDTLKIIGSDVS